MLVCPKRWSSSSERIVAIVDCLGRQLAPETVAALRASVSKKTKQGYAASPHHRLIVKYGSDASDPKLVNFEMSVFHTEAYAAWTSRAGQSQFGEHPDAKAVAVVAQLGTEGVKVLDVGAGTGRNGSRSRPAVPEACPFCQIVSGALPAAVVATTPHAVAFLDAHPVFVGHTLVVPRTHVGTLSDLAASELPGFFSDVQRFTRAVENGCESHGSFVAMNNGVSQSVPHLHVHIVPRKHKDGLRGFFWPREKYADDAEREAFRAKIASAL